jgi:glycosyltransferase involved in cell wall biosynthesis
MQIAIVAPSPVPYTIGGAEYLWWGLLDALNATGKHQAELIKLPSPDGDLWQLMASYRRFAELDLDHFDLVISTKYPAWMVIHPNHVVYLQHKLRGLYDSYPRRLSTTLPVAKELPSSARPLLDQLQRGPARRNELPALWEMIEALRNTDPTLTEIPGPLSRAIVHYLDRIGLEPPAIRRYLAISHNVAQRADYFPSGVAVDVVYHPSHRGMPAPDAGGSPITPEHPILFTASRLDGPKRLDLLIKAFRETEVAAELQIAGTGPAESELQTLAAGDPRIRLLGWQSDAEIAAGYQRASVVPFIPYDEDYGLITVEAMQAARLVLTTTDAGGVNEFVLDGQTGRSVAPTKEALAQAMEALLADPAHAERMGQAARERVANITWAPVVEALTAAVPRRARLVVVTTFPVYPPESGGASRIYHLYRELARWADITLVTLTGDPSEAGTYSLGAGFREIRVAKAYRHRLRDKVMGRRLGASVDDIVAIDYARETSELASVLRAACGGADRVIASHPYLYPQIRRVWSGPIWYEAHNIEADMKAAVLAEPLASGSASARRALERVETVEKQCAQDAEWVICVSAEERDAISARYQLPSHRLMLAPNGIAFTDPAARAANKQRVGLADRYTALFIGSWHGPNVEAALHISRLAEQCPSVDFMLMGKVCDAPLGMLPPNCHCLGAVSHSEKQYWFASADCALNPITSGAGSNLKLVEYAAAGMPIITTPFGNRGVGLVPVLPGY